MYRIGLSTTGGKIFYSEDDLRINPKFFENCAKAGIDVIEVSNVYEQTINFDYKSLKKYADEYGVELWSYHLPFKPFDIIDISNDDKNLRKGTIEIFREIIKKASDIGFDKFIVHSSCVFEREDQNFNIKERMENSKECLVKLADIAEECGGVIVVENLPPICFPTNIEEHLDLLGADSRLRACFDTNHKLGEEKSSDHIRALGDKLVTTHISDYDFVNERHWFPGVGKIDWQEIYGALKDINYNGVWLYEIGYKSALSPVRDLVCEDIFKNAKEIFENKEITRI